MGCVIRCRKTSHRDWFERSFLEHEIDLRKYFEALMRQSMLTEHGGSRSDAARELMVCAE